MFTTLRVPVELVRSELGKKCPFSQEMSLCLSTVISHFIALWFIVLHINNLFTNWRSSAGLLEKEMATHSSVLVWRIPGTGEPGRLPSVGSRRVGHDWRDLAAAAAAAAAAGLWSKPYWHPFSSSICSFVSLCPILVTTTIFQTSKLLLYFLWWSLISDFWCYCCKKRLQKD